MKAMASPESSECGEEEPLTSVPPLQAVQTLRAEFDIFASRLREKIVSLERNLTKAEGTVRSPGSRPEGLADATASASVAAGSQSMPLKSWNDDRANGGARSTASLTDGGSRSLDPTAFAGFSTFSAFRTRSSENQTAWCQEPPALEDHRLRRVEANAPKRRYTSFGPLHSVRVELGSDFRLHNRWLQLSMQCDANQAVTEFRNAAHKNSKRPPISKKVSGRKDMTIIFLQSLHPGGRLRVAWDSMAMFLLCLDSLLLPLSFAWDWQKELTNTSSIILYMIFLLGLVFWSFDILLNFNTSYFSHGALITSQKEIAKHYLSSWFLVDLTLVVLDCFTAAHTLLEDSAFADLTFSRALRVLRVSRLVRLVKMAKIERVLQEFAASTGRQWVMIVVTMLNTTCFILVFQHIASCAWYGLGRSEVDASSSWIALAGVQNSLPSVQYLHAFRYIMIPITSPELAAENWWERCFDIGYTFIWCVLLGTGVSRILATVSEVTAMNESKSIQRREVRRYLRAQEASFQLVTRVMNFVDYKLDKLSLINFDQSLISDNLQTELCVNQRSRYLEAVAVCKVTKGLFPECFAAICTVLKKTVCENGQDVYVAGGVSSCLYITATGEYLFIEGFDRDGDSEEVTGIHTFEELSLYVDNLPHHSFLIAKTFAEMYLLEGNDLVECLKSTPGAAAMFFEYAREYTSTMHRIGGRVERKASQSIAERCCKMTRVYQEIFPDQKFKLENISSSEEILRSDSGLASTGTHRERGIMWLLREGWLEDLEEFTLPSQLRSCLVELHLETGSHMIFEQPQDRERAESSCISILALLANRYEIFTRPQDVQNRLKGQQWEQLQEILNWVRPSNEEIHAVLVLLAIRALGKSKFVLCQVPSHNRRPESAVLYLVDYSSNVVPSIKDLSDRGLTFVKMALQLHEAFNFAQMLQGENVPANVAQLQELVSRQGEHAIRFYILFLLGFMSGLEGGSGSRFLTAQRAENVIEAIGMLQHLLESTPRGIYWAYLCARARALKLPSQTPEDLVLIRLACLMRIHPENNCFNQLVAAWNRLGEAERTTLTDHFLADGIDEVAFVFEFLPDCVVNAMKNPIVTLTGLLEVLEELLQTLQPAVAMNPDLKDAKIINVDLADMSEFISCVQNHFVFETCISRCKIRFAGRRAQCEMTGGNWGRIHEADSDLTSLAYNVRDVMQRQQVVERHLSKLSQKPKRAPTFTI